MTNQGFNMFLANRLAFEDGPSALEVQVPYFIFPDRQLCFISEIVESNIPSGYSYEYCCDVAHLEKVFQECPINSIRCLIPRSLSNSGLNETLEVYKLSKAPFTHKNEDYLSYRFDFFEGKRFYYDPEATGEQIEQLKYRTIIDFEGMYVD
ncbi:hypothetical protein ACIDE9_00685 [Methylophilus sp. 'Pure River']|jgi:hypothetical protein|uniref:hypothetical protein n=1 Tax=Methylophilus sp. 'Pure River' TaxID=3377117 RepID=UPI00398F2116